MSVDPTVKSHVMYLVYNNSKSFYKNQFNADYKNYEQCIKKIQNYVRPSLNVMIRTLIYYRSEKMCEYVIRNNIQSQLLTRNEYNILNK